MSMNPVEMISASSEKRSKSDLGTNSNRELRLSESDPQAAPASRGEVQVQRDSERSDVIVIKYLDRSGNLILQMPSSQVLHLAQAIEKALEQDAQKRTASRVTGSRSEGGSTDGH